MRFLALFTLVFVSSACAESAPIAPEVSEEQILASLSARHFDPDRPSEALKSENARARLEALARLEPDAPFISPSAPRQPFATMARANRVGSSSSILRKRMRRLPAFERRPSQA